VCLCGSAILSARHDSTTRHFLRTILYSLAFILSSAILWAAIMTTLQESMPLQEQLLFDLIDTEIHAHRQRAWPAPLSFNGFRCSRVDNVPAAGHCCYQNDVDLFKDMRNTLFTNIIIRFDPCIFPVDGGWGKNSGGQKLICALCSASWKSRGCDLKCNGNQKKGNQNIFFVLSIGKMTG
jgi:hypothetical protein